MNKPRDPVPLLPSSVLIIWNTSKLIHDASLAFPKTSLGILSHSKLPHLVFVPSVPQFPMGPCKFEGQIIVECKSTAQIQDDKGYSGLLQPSPLHTAPSDDHLDVECKSSVQIDDDDGYSEPLQHAGLLSGIIYGPSLDLSTRSGLIQALLSALELGFVTYALLLLLFS